MPVPRPLRPAAFSPEVAAVRPAYPKAPRANQVDDYHGTRVADPFRPLEDADSPETRKWIDAENALTTLRPRRDSRAARPRAAPDEALELRALHGAVREGGRLFYSRNDGLQNQAVLYVVDADGTPPRVLLDPNTLCEGRYRRALGRRVSRDGKTLAYGLASAGSDWKEWRVLDVACGTETGDVVKWIKFSAPP